MLEGQLSLIFFVAMNIKVRFSKKFLFQFLLQYNSTYEPLQLTLKVEVMENLSKIHRVLQISGGNMILVSPRSYGKWTLTKLAAFIAGMYLVFYIIDMRLHYVLSLLMESFIFTALPLNRIDNYL